MRELVEPRMELPTRPEVVTELQTRLEAERARREKSHEAIPDGAKGEFIHGQVIRHSPDTVRHMQGRGLVENLLANQVRLRGFGTVLAEKALGVFARNDFMPDVVFFRPDKAARLQPRQVTLPPPDLVVEVLSDSTACRDRGEKFRNCEAHGVGEYWIIDPDAEVLEPYLLRDGAGDLAGKSGIGEVRRAVVEGFCAAVRVLFDPNENGAALQRLFAGAASPG